VAKLFYKPVGMISSRIASRLGRSAFAALWRLVDSRQPPRAQQQRASLGKLALALALEGAVFRLAGGIVDHLSREWFARFTGRWPGEREHEPEAVDAEQAASE